MRARAVRSLPLFLVSSRTALQSSLFCFKRVNYRYRSSKALFDYEEEDESTHDVDDISGVHLAAMESDQRLNGPPKYPGDWSAFENLNETDWAIYVKHYTERAAQEIKFLEDVSGERYLYYFTHMRDQEARSLEAKFQKLGITLAHFLPTCALRHSKGLERLDQEFQFETLQDAYDYYVIKGIGMESSETPAILLQEMKRRELQMPSTEIFHKVLRVCQKRGDVWSARKVISVMMSSKLNSGGIRPSATLGKPNREEMVSVPTTETWDLLQKTIATHNSILKGEKTVPPTVLDREIRRNNLMHNAWEMLEEKSRYSMIV